MASCFSRARSNFSYRRPRGHAPIYYCHLIMANPTKKTLSKNLAQMKVGYYCPPNDPIKLCFYSLCKELLNLWIKKKQMDQGV